MRIWRSKVVACALVWLVALPPIAVHAAPAPAPQPETTTLSADGSTPLPVPEDPLGQYSEQQIPEISIDVDVRDGHLLARVVDLWGPGRASLVVRTYTSASISDTSAAGAWQLNQLLDVLDGGSGAYLIREVDGTRGTYSFTSESRSGSAYVELFTKSFGVYSTMEKRGTLDCPAPDEPSVCNKVWDGYYTVFLPKGLIRRFRAVWSAGLIETESDANGNITSYSWVTFVDGLRPYVWKVIDPASRETIYGYERYGGFVCTATREDESGRTRCVAGGYHYRVKSVTDPYGRSVSYTYDASGRLTQVMRSSGGSTSYNYDTSGRLTSVTNPRGYTTAIQWAVTTPARVAQVTPPPVTPPDNASTGYTYAVDANGRVTQTVVTDARGNRTTYAIDASGNVTSVTDPFSKATQFVYDTRHNVTQVTDPRGVITTYQYNARNRSTRIVQDSGVNRLNLTTTLTWDGETPTAADNLMSVVNPNGIQTNYTYDTKHNLTSVKRGVGRTEEATTTYTPTTWGGVASVTDPRNNTTSYGYTTRRQLQTITPPVGGTTTFGYDTFDDQVSMTDGNAHTWQTAYNARRQVTTITDPLNNQVRHEYDANGNRTRTYDAKNQPTTFTYDSRDRLTSITDPLNGGTVYQYDAVGNLTQITNARNYPTRFRYDAANRLDQVTDALTQITSYGYDAVGNRTSMRDRKNVLHSYTYDGVNRLTQVSAGGTTISYTYDSNGNRLTMTDPTGTTQYDYDSLDRLTRTMAPDNKSVQFAYDKAGNRTRLVYPGGTVSLDYAYDIANRLARITQGTMQWTFGYDGAGNRSSLTQPNGTSTTYAYRTNNWHSSITHTGPGGAIQAVSYTYDPNGNRLTQTDSSGTTTFTYDPLNHLREAAYPGTFGTWTWTYDAVGNRTSQTAPSGTTPYDYDANNRLLSAGAVTYTHDPNGNLERTSAGQTFTYDPFNRMTQAVGAGGTAIYAYNGDGLKIQRVGPDGATRYYHDGIRPIWETDGAGTMTAQLDRDVFGNLLSRREASGTRRYFHPDGLGSTVALSDEAGGVAASMLYDAWGNVRVNSGVGHGRYRFTGAELDEASGLYHMGARFYDPTVGRWLSEDPVQDHHFEPSSLNFYSYASNNPSLFVDPDGQVIQLPLLYEAAAILAVRAAVVLNSQAGGTRIGIQRAVALGAAGMAAVGRILAQRGEFFERANRVIRVQVGNRTYGRLHDLMVRTGGRVRAIEVKAGFVEWSSRIEAQIRADAEILRDKARYGIDEITWAVEKAETRVIQALERAGIQIEYYQAPPP